MVKALQELLLPDWNNAFIVATIGPKGIIIPKVRERDNWIVRHGHQRTEHRLPGVLMYDGPMTVKSLLRTEVHRITCEYFLSFCFIFEWLGY
mgnify:FL=1